MKTMKKFFMLCAAALMMGCMTSCLDDGDIENTYTNEDFYTITGGLEMGYTLYSDNATYIKLDKSAFQPGSSFGTTERAIVLTQYKDIHISSDRRGLTNPTIAGYVPLPTTDPMSQEVAEAAKVLEADSCDNVAKLNVWAYRGYLTACTYTYFGRTAPTMNLVYDPATVRTDSVDVTLTYNLHAQSNTGSGNYYTCFRLDQFDSLVPGSGDVVMTVKCKGTETQILKIARKNLHKGNWLEDK